MDAKNEIRNRIMTRMEGKLSPNQRAMLEEALVFTLKDYDVTLMETELATTDDTNERILEMFAAIKGQHVHPETMRQYLYSTRRFIDTTHKNLLTVHSMDVEYFMHKLRTEVNVRSGKTNGKTSVNNHKRNLSSLFSWMVVQRMIQFNPCDQVEDLKETEKPIDRLSVEEFDQMRSGCKDTRERCLIELLRCTGLRTEEIVALKIKDIDWMERKIVEFVPKQNKFRTVFIDKLTMGYLRRYVEGRDEEEPLFLGRGGKALGRSGVNYVLRCIGKRAGLNRRLYVHLLRRTCASHILERGGTIEDAGIYLGHKQKSVTGKYYTQFGEDHIRQIFDKYVAAA